MTMNVDSLFQLHVYANHILGMRIPTDWFIFMIVEIFNLNQFGNGYCHTSNVTKNDLKKSTNNVVIRISQYHIKSVNFLS